MTGTLRLYLRIVFGWCWGLGLVMLMARNAGAPDVVVSALWMVAVGGAPALAAIVAARSLGPWSLRAYASRLFDHRGSAAWLVGVPCAVFALHGVAAALSGAEWHWRGAAELASAVAATTLADPGPLEEFGWRGFLQPLLQNRLQPLAASIVVGVIWGLWHLPVLVLPGFPQSESSLPLVVLVARFLAQTTALSVLMGIVLNRTRGFVIPAMLAHWAANQGAAGHVFGFDMTAWTLTLVGAACVFGALDATGRLGAAPRIAHPLGAK